MNVDRSRPHKNAQVGQVLYSEEILRHDPTEDDMTEHDDLLRESYEGEVFGEAFFGALAESSRDPVRRERLEALRAIEADTASTLRPLVAAAGIETGDAKAKSAGVTLAESTRDQPWDAVLQGLRSALPTFLAKYERLRSLAPDRDHPVLLNLVAHEQVIDRFADLELAGHADESLAVLRAHLDGSRRATLR